jgi:hypothetical protein
MLVSKKLVFLELQKTGSTHIKQLLKQTVGGKNDGKHNQATPELRAGGKSFIGSIRDPWSWYLSLFTYGCQQKGGVYIRTTNAKHWNKLTPEERATPGFEQYDADYCKANLYQDPESATAFRAWLKLVTASGPQRKIIEDGFYKSPISAIGGLMTYRYFLLFTDTGVDIPDSVKTLKALEAYESEHLFVKHIIRNETLAEDLITAVQACGEKLSDADCALIREAPKTNTSVRKHPRSHYYDDECVKLVAKREKLIIDKFGYKYK